MKNIAFVKMVASGNDFVVMDNRKAVIPGAKLRSFAREICDRNYGAGGDGLIALERSKKADFRMRIINSDGSEAEMCGNGARCAALFAVGNKIAGKSMDFETLAGIIQAEVKGDVVKLKMSDPNSLKLDINLVLSDGTYNVNFVNTGVPHTVIFVEHIEGQDVKTTGKEVRYHSAFAPRGTNADFVEAVGKNLIKVRTYERGVEGETLACGTGVTASAIISAVVKNFKSPVTCLTKGGDSLKIYFKRSGDDFTDVYLEGGAREVFLGRYLYK
ncbi:MAG: diaminopimelate epimerase [Candidatus Omnitrophica bacterium]|nr:diaminopimelate epimerase [Candidatus Omnitrophota bacterium]